jgi:transposase InsO family protein
LLRRDGERVNHKRVERLMKEQGIKAKRPDIKFELQH